MSVLREILENIAEYFENHPQMADYHGLDYYFDIYTINANTEVPCICFDVKYGDDNSEQKGMVINQDCRSYFRNFDIKLYTVTTDVDVLIEELWDFEESVLKSLNVQRSWQDIHPKLQNLKFVGAMPITSVYKQAFREDYEDEWFANVVTVRYEMEYVLT
jgi:hypothetical protein